MNKIRFRLSAVFWRRISQLLFFAVFLFLFIKTDYDGSDHITWAVNILFRIDPFLAFSAMLAEKAVIYLMLPALVTLLLTLIFGRFFCGWVCPMGSLIDISKNMFGKAKKRPDNGGYRLKYYLLFFFLTASAFGLPLSGYLDPFSLLMRGFTFGAEPALHYASDSFFTWTYLHAPAWVNAVTEPVYSLLKDHVLPMTPKVYTLAVFSSLLLLAVLGLSKIEKRFFCRRLCPLGAMLALTSRFSVFRLNGGDEECGSCMKCASACRMKAIDDKRGINSSECILCMDCKSGCPQSKITYGLRIGAPQTNGINLSRRAAVTGIAAGVLAPLMLPARPFAGQTEILPVRPPGALEEKKFLELCVRCGECMKVCIGNALHSAWLETGLEGVFTPKLIARAGYCEYNCTLCGQVCPTGAIKVLSLEEKHKTVIGRAYFDKNRCLPFIGTPCIVCEEHCPTSDKAIKFKEAEVLNDKGETVTLDLPYIVNDLCVGCGICETRCPVEGRSAVIITAEGESRHASLYGSYGGGY